MAKQVSKAQTENRCYNSSNYIEFYEGYLQSFYQHSFFTLFPNHILLIILQLRCYLVEYLQISRGK